MFGFAQWDSPLAVVLEVLLSVAVIVVVMWLARLANLNSGPPPANPQSDPGQATNAPEDRPSNPMQPGNRS